MLMGIQDTGRLLLTATLHGPRTLAGLQLHWRVASIRASVLTTKHNAYIEAERVIGCGDVRVVAAHILPNVAVPILVLTTVGIAWAILIGASLSFLGLGAQPPFCRVGPRSVGRTQLHGCGVVGLDIPQAWQSCSLSCR